MYCIGYDDVFPIFETIAIHTFNSGKILDKKNLILNTFDKVLSAPYFNGIGKFDEYGYYTIDGKRNKSRLTEISWSQIRRMISKGELKSVGFHIKQEEQFALKNDDVSFTFGRNAVPEEPGMNRLHVHISKESYGKCTEFSLFNYFVELCELSEACYGFACVHIDSTDSQAVTECYKNTIEFLPVDCINSNRYVTNSDKVIKDVCWINFISNKHLRILKINPEPFLSVLPFYKKNDRGIYFAVANNPYMGEESYDRIRRLREIFRPIICEDDWYNFV